MFGQSPQRRNLFIAFGFLFIVLIVFYSSPSIDAERFKNIVPGYGSDSSQDPASTTKTPVSQTTAAADSDDEGSQNEETDDTNSESPAIPEETIKTSQFHYLIPASGNNRRLCFNLISSAANRYPVPALMGWNGTGLLDASATHLAKLRAIERYLNSLPSEEDDDIVLIVDGYDVILQLPPDIMLERYFKVMERENKRTAERFGLTIDQVYEKDLHTTLYFGPDKICWPINWDAPRCWAVPPSNLPAKAFGPKTGNGAMPNMLPKWLNSGTLIGPASHMRDYVSATMYEILVTWDPNYQWKDSDQYYLANVWGRQEYFRSLKMSKDGKVSGGPSNRKLPRVYNKQEKIEFHVGIEYESSMFQTKAGYEPFVDWIHYNGTKTPTAMMEKDMFELGDDFKPYPIEMPKKIEEALSKIYDDIPEAHPGSTSKDWIRNIVLGTNFVTKHIWALWHVTGDKDVIEDQYTKFWFYPFARSLVKAAVKHLQADNRISDKPIGGRYWVHKTTYPDSDTLADDMGGGWSDEDGGKWINYQTMCKKWEQELLGGEKTPASTKDRTPETTNALEPVSGDKK
ncbi:hypothetical protein B0J13DRAFT_529140 [Dactylonectria estremocensis]|uniref:Uncharacterized protein n=1 Tax=Dactylonectria estremocensis TaxID=1079267 RepID=A0A9P9E9D8_9HYPO|nr:hypothetical protein B0J13DRAFT_529140 [Dactylonectria estremocensis]